MEKLRYDEAREWFWVRTAVWFVVAVLASAVAHFLYLADLFEPLGTRVWLSVGVGTAAVLLAILAGYISMQMPWMRQAMRISYLANGPFCAAVAGGAAFLIGGFVMTAIRQNPPDAIEHPAQYHAFLTHVDASYQLMIFAICAAAFWGFMFGSWFAMRRDRYFVEPIMD